MHCKLILYLSLLSTSMIQSTEIVRLIKQEDIFNNHIIAKLDTNSYSSLLRACKLIATNYSLHDKIYTLFQNNHKEEAKKKINHLPHPMIFLPTLYLGIQNTNKPFINWYITTIGKNNLDTHKIKIAMQYSKKKQKNEIAKLLNSYIATPQDNLYLQYNISGFRNMVSFEQYCCLPIL